MRLLIDLKDEYFIIRERLYDFNDQQFDIFFANYVEACTMHIPLAKHFDYRLRTLSVLDDYVGVENSLLAQIQDYSRNWFGVRKPLSKEEIQENARQRRALYNYLMNMANSIRQHLKLYGIYNTRSTFKVHSCEHKGSGLYVLYHNTWVG